MSTSDHSSSGNLGRPSTVAAMVQTPSRYNRSLSFEENISSPEPSRELIPRYSSLDSNSSSTRLSMQSLRSLSFEEPSSFSKDQMKRIRRPLYGEKSTSSSAERSLPFPRSSSFEGSEGNYILNSSTHFTIPDSSERRRSVSSQIPFNPQPSSPEGFGRNSPFATRVSHVGRSFSYECRTTGDSGSQSHQSSRPGLTNIHRSTVSIGKPEGFRRSISIETSSITSVPAPVFGRRPSSSGLPPRRPISSRRLSII